MIKNYINLRRRGSQIPTRYGSEDRRPPSCEFSQNFVFLREGNKKYIEFPTQIEKLSKHIFEDNPFDVIFLDSTKNDAYKKMIAIRNYIAHESGESRLKFLKCCFGNNESNFKEPNDYLQTRERTTCKSYYTYYVDIIKDIVVLLVNPPE